MKRGESGLSLVVGIDKPTGMSSHDVVNHVRHIFKEKRVGHTGTLDPLATGVLPICVGPATRLSTYLTAHDKYYHVRMVFGAQTDTDDRDGNIIRTAAVPDEVLDPFFAQSFLDSLVGTHKQLPPVYSAIKVNGVKACDAARRGNIIDLAPRDIEVFSAQLMSISGHGLGEERSWDVSFHVSKGTYIRSLVRDIGTAFDSYAYVDALRRIQSGKLSEKSCVSLEVLEEIGADGALDPVQILGFRFAFVDEDALADVGNGKALSRDTLVLYTFPSPSLPEKACGCTPGLIKSDKEPLDSELVSIVGNNRLYGIYEYSVDLNLYKPRCVFQSGVSRGSIV